MISISRLLCDSVGPGDYLRYREKRSPSPETAPKPVVVWNCTRQCNLGCVHCYASAGKGKSTAELDTTAAKRFITDLADFGVPAILFSGGEPLMRQDLFELAGFARRRGIRIALSTNGTLITDAVAAHIKACDFAEVGISLDGIGENNDRFRGQAGAYRAALEGVRRCKAAGVRVSLRFTITRFNYTEIPAILRLIEDEAIERVCFYHLAYSGRGSKLQKEDISHAQTRQVIDLICRSTLDFHRRGIRKEILTVGNHADGVYLYLKERGNPERAAKILDLLRTNGGNNSGIRISAVDDLGNVHPDQFWWHYKFGNIRERKFGDIWQDTSEPLLAGLRARRPLLKGRCARCAYIDSCNGNLRVRAEAVFHDVWAEDPACYLTDPEIGLS